MSTGQWDDPEYPYLPRYGARVVDSTPPLTARSPLWRTVVRWGVRVIVAAGAMAILAMAVLFVLFFRATSVAWSLSDLEDKGVSITYWHQMPTNEDALPDYVRERVSDRWWSEPRDVSYNGPIWQFAGEANEEEVRQILRSCGTFRRLRSFEFANDHFTCARLEHWPSLGQLEELDIESSKLTDEDLAIIGKMRSLTRLRLSKGKFSTSGLASVAKLPNLESLTLDEVELKVNEQIAGGFQALASLVVGRSPSFDDQAALALGSLPKVEELNFHQSPIGDRGLAHLIQSGLVRSLIVGDGSRVTDAVFADLTKYPPPAWLVLSGPSITDAGLAALEGKEFPTLILEGTAITDEGFRSLAKVQGLSHLDLGNTKVTGQGLAYLAAEQELGWLNLSDDGLNDEGVKLLAKIRCPDLVLIGTPLTDEQLMLFVENDSITRLNVMETKITPEGVTAFYEARKKRFKGSGREETLTLECDFPEVAEPYYNRWGMSDYGIGGDIPFTLPQ